MCLGSVKYLKNTYERRISSIKHSEMIQNCPIYSKQLDVSVFIVSRAHAGFLAEISRRQLARKPKINYKPLLNESHLFLVFHSPSQVHFYSDKFVSKF